RMGLRIVLSALALSATGGLLSAQTKVAVINLQRAVLDSAEIKKASADMEAKYKPRADEVAQMQKDIANISDQLQKGKLSPEAQSDLNAQGQRKQRELQRLQEDLQADVDRDRNEILARSGQKMTDVVKKIAEERGLDLV